MKVKNTRRQQNKSKYVSLVSSVLVGTMLFLTIQPTFVKAMTKETDLSLFLADGDVEVGTKVGNNGHNQIKYKYNNKEVDVTKESNVTNADPDTDGEYIVWMAQIDNFWQIMLYYIPGDQTIQLSRGENNVDPSISGNNIVWEGQVNGVWQIFLFDGIKTTQLTSGDMPAQDAGIEGDYVVYTQKDPSEEGWKVYLYEISGDLITNLTPDTYGKGVKITGTRVTWTELVDGKTIKKKYLTEPEESEEPIEDSGTSEVVGPVVEDPIVVEEATDTPAVEDNEITEENTEEASESTSVVEETPIEEILDTILEEEEELPEEVTIEDIEKELGITDDTVEEVIIEDEPPVEDEIPEVPILEEPEEELPAEEVEESTST